MANTINMMKFTLCEDFADLGIAFVVVLLVVAMWVYLYEEVGS